MEDFFALDERLGIPLPQLQKDFDEYTKSEQTEMLLRWEQIRGTIPERIKQIERVIIAKQDELSVENNFVRSCRLNSEIADLASAINDLHLWFRVNQDITAERMHR